MFAWLELLYSTSLKQSQLRPNKIKELSAEELAKYSAFAARTGLQFHNPTNLVNALTHSSWREDADTRHESLRYMGTDQQINFQD